MASTSFALVLAGASLIAACSAPRPVVAVPSLAQDEPQSEIPVRSPAGPQGVSGELVPSWGSTRVLIGPQELDGYWAPNDELLLCSLESSFESEESWLGIEWGFAWASQVESENRVDAVNGAGLYEVELQTKELYAGLHRSFLRHGFLRPYVGAGLSLVIYEAQKNFETPTYDYDDDNEDNLAWGLYAHGGLSVQITENLSVGADVRMLEFTEVDGIGGDGDLDYTRLALFIGFGN